MRIIEAKKRHLNLIARLHNELSNFHRKIDKYYKPGSKKSQKWFKKYLFKNFGKKNFKILVAQEKEKIIGYFIGKIERSKPYAAPKKIGKITSAFILKKYRRKGVGRQMFEKLLEWFRVNKIKYIELSVDSRNKIGLGAWKKFGFFEFQKKMRLDL